MIKLYLNVWFGKCFGSFFDILDGVPLGINVHSDWMNFVDWWPFIVIGEFEFDEWLFLLSNDNDDDDDATPRAFIWWIVDRSSFVVTDDNEGNDVFDVALAERCLSDCNKSRNWTSSFIVGNNRATIDSFNRSSMEPSISFSEM